MSPASIARAVRRKVPHSERRFWDDLLTSPRNTRRCPPSRLIIWPCNVLMRSLHDRGVHNNVAGKSCPMRFEESDDPGPGHLSPEFSLTRSGSELPDLPPRLNRATPRSSLVLTSVRWVFVSENVSEHLLTLAMDSRVRSDRLCPRKGNTFPVSGIVHQSISH
jgi:hypothetical protein